MQYTVADRQAVRPYIRSALIRSEAENYSTAFQLEEDIRSYAEATTSRQLYNREIGVLVQQEYVHTPAVAADSTFSDSGLDIADESDSSIDSDESEI